jgi:hypothetical protein
MRERPPLVIVDRDEEYSVERIDDSQLFPRQLQYFVKWVGYDERSWKPETDIDGLKAVNNFHTEQCSKPRS